MAQPFTPDQLSEIRAALLESARHHALHTGIKKTSLDMLTADAGIAKSTFYKFYESKEILFLEVAGLWEADILSAAAQALTGSEGLSGRQRAAAFVCAAFERLHALGCARFMREDLPLLSAFIPADEAREHTLSSARRILSALREAKISFTAPEENVLSVIQLLYLSILSIDQFGGGYFPALRTLVESACDKLVA